MMLGERHRTNPTVHVPPWALLDDDLTNPTPISPTTSNAQDYSPVLNLQEALNVLQRYFPSSQNELGTNDHTDYPVDAYSCDNFRMYEFKVKRCGRGRSHDWTECPFAHPGEKARRRDPRKYHYSGTACPDFRKGNCKKGDACEYSHGVFECWLHPSRYRTQPCKDGICCRRRVCFFAHSPDQLRVLPLGQSLSPVSPPETPPGPETESPPMSPLNRSFGSGSINEMMVSLRNLQLGKVKSFTSSSWGGSGFGSPRGSVVVRPGFFSLPVTPTQVPVRGGLGFWDKVCLEEGGEEEEEEEEEVVVMERVESGRDIRMRMFEKICMENSLDRVEPRFGGGSGPDVGWVSDLVK